MRKTFNAGGVAILAAVVVGMVIGVVGTRGLQLAAGPEAYQGAMAAGILVFGAAASLLRVREVREAVAAFLGPLSRRPRLPR